MGKTSDRSPDVGSAFEQTEHATGYLGRSSWQVIEHEPPHGSSCRRLTEPSGVARQVFESVEDPTRLMLCAEGGPFTSRQEVEQATIRAQQEHDLDGLRRLLERVDDPESEAFGASGTTSVDAPGGAYAPLR